MDSTEEKLSRHNRWKSLIEEQEESGLSQSEFCRRNQLVASQFGYYRSLFKTSRPIEKLEFQPIQFKVNEETLGMEIKALLPNGLQFIFPSHIAVKQIKQLLEVMLSC